MSYVYEISATIEGDGNSHFVQYRGASPEEAKRWFRPTARLMHPNDFLLSTDLEVQDFEIWKLDPDNDFEQVEKIE